MPDGEYRLGGLTVTVANGRATPRRPRRSVLTLDRALANFLRFTGSSLEHGLRLLTTNPAAMIGLSGLPDSASSTRPAGLPARRPPRPGIPANFVAVNPDGTLAASFLTASPSPDSQSSRHRRPFESVASAHDLRCAKGPIEARLVTTARLQPGHQAQNRNWGFSPWKTPLPSGRRRITPAVLPHHRTCRSASGGS